MALSEEWSSINTLIKMSQKVTRNCTINYLPKNMHNLVYEYTYIALMNLSIWTCGTSFKSLRKPNKNINNRHQKPSWVIGHGCSRDSQSRQPPIFAFGGPSEVEAKFLLKTPCASETGPRDPCTGTDLNAPTLGINFHENWRHHTSP